MTLSLGMGYKRLLSSPKLAVFVHWQFVAERCQCSAQATSMKRPSESELACGGFKFKLVPGVISARLGSVSIDAVNCYCLAVRGLILLCGASGLGKL